MKILKNLLSGLLLCVTGSISYADGIEPTETPHTGHFKNVGLGFLASYTEFKFNSTTGTNYYLFNGHSDLYSVSAGNINLAPSWTIGLALFRVNTDVQSNMFLDPGVSGSASQEIRNNSLGMHVMKQFSPNIFLDLAGAYGQNNVRTRSKIMPNSLEEQTAYGRSNNDSGFASLTGLYTRSWNNFTLLSSLRALYSQVNAASYSLQFNANEPAQTVLPLTNKVWFLMENAEISYSTHAATFPLKPFVNAGLLQVPSFSNSRSVVGTPINGISPQLSMNKGGYRLGGGISFQHKNWTLRLEEQYYNSVSVYTSYQTLASIHYAVS